MGQPINMRLHEPIQLSPAQEAQIIKFKLLELMTAQKSADLDYKIAQRLGNTERCEELLGDLRRIAEAIEVLKEELAKLGNDPAPQEQQHGDNDWQPANRRKVPIRSRMARLRRCV